LSTSVTVHRPNRGSHTNAADPPLLNATRPPVGRST
jgi:hypothetical protein